jgi:CubicO group peptidase (beta-lactamase class C family)
MVERVNSNVPLQQYMETNIWVPLGITTATFRIDDRPDLKERLPDMARRQGLIHPIFGSTMTPTGKIICDHDSTAAAEHAVTELPSYDDGDDNFNLGNDDFGGGGIYCSAPDFAKLLSSLCSSPPSSSSQSSSYPLLHPSTINLIFTPQLISGPAKAQLQKLARIREVNNAFGGLPLHKSAPLNVDWGLGGMLVLDDIWGENELEQSIAMDQGLSGLGFGYGNGSASSEGREARYTAQQQVGRRRSRGSMFWGGTANLYWWMDRAAGVSGVWASQLVPAGDPWTLRMLGRFEAAVYEQVGVHGAGGVQEGTLEQQGPKEQDQQEKQSQGRDWWATVGASGW